MASIDFTVSGLNKGDWKEAEVFYRGNGEVIGSEKMTRLCSRKLGSRNAYKR